MCCPHLHYNIGDDLQEEAITALCSGSFGRLQDVRRKVDVDLSIYLPKCPNKDLSWAIQYAYSRGDIEYLDYILPHVNKKIKFDLFYPYPYHNFDQATRLLLKITPHLPSHWYSFIVAGAFRLRSVVLLELIDRKSNITEEFLSKYKIDDAWKQIKEIDYQILSRLSVWLIPDLSEIVLSYIW